MKLESSLKHAAGALLSKFLSRNNDLDGFWAPGMLYREVPSAPHCIAFDLKTSSAQPLSEVTAVASRTYSAWLRRALKHAELTWEDVERAVLMIEFNAPINLPAGHYYPDGDPFVCTIELLAASGHTASASSSARCQPWSPGRFSRRGG